MRRKTKIGLTIATLGIGVLALSACTNSFCSTKDKAHMVAALDNGVCKFYNADDASLPEVTYQLDLPGVSGVVFDYKFAYNSGVLNQTLTNAKNQGISYVYSNVEYWAAIDLVVVQKVMEASQTTSVTTAEQLNQLLEEYGYIRFASDAQTNLLWDNWKYYDETARNNMITYGEQNKYGISYEIDKIPNNDFIKLYKATLEYAIGQARGCLTVTGGEFGSFGWNEKKGVAIEAKDYSYAWSRGFFEGLLVFPIGALIDVTVNALQPLGTGLNGTNGWAQLLTILIVTVIVRAIIFLLSFKSTINNARMTELQPQIAKIQAKYPNANSSQTEKARMADEMNKLYKKNKINPLSSIVVMIFQFPIFICVWGAFTGSSWLATGSFLGMNFSDSISSIIFNGVNWVNGSAWTALILFILMAGSQVLSMLIPQIMQKRRNKKVAKLGKNPAQASQGRTMKIVMWVMMVMIIFMGFSLASAMGLYWFIGALISIAQTLITQKVIERQSSKEK